MRIAKDLLFHFMGPKWNRLQLEPIKKDATRDQVTWNMISVSKNNLNKFKQYQQKQKTTHPGHNGGPATIAPAAAPKVIKVAPENDEGRRACVFGALICKGS